MVCIISILEAEILVETLEGELSPPEEDAALALSRGLIYTWLHILSSHAHFGPSGPWLVAAWLVSGCTGCRLLGSFAAFSAIVSSFSQRRSNSKIVVKIFFSILNKLRKTNIGKGGKWSSQKFEVVWRNLYLKRPELRKLLRSDIVKSTRQSFSLKKCFSWLAPFTVPLFLPMNSGKISL